MNILIKKYINNLTINKLNEFMIKNDINLSNDELIFLLELVKTNVDDILVNSSKYLNIIKDKININEFNKIEKLFLYYKNRYQGYLF